MPGAIRLRLSSAARMRRPTTSGAKARTTCSTSGSSGIKNLGRSGLSFDYLFNLLLDLIDQPLFARFDVQTQQRLSVRRANVEAPFRRFERVAVGKVCLSFTTEFFLHVGNH